MVRVARLPANDRAPPRERPPPDVRRGRKLRYHAFLSYSHKDEALADWLHRELEGFRVPHGLNGRLGENGTIPRRLTPIFRDRNELAAAHDLSEEIEAALASTRFLIVLCSPAAAQSHWTNAEIATFKRNRPDGCILALIAAGEPFASDVAGREAEECFPPALRQRYDRRGRPTGKRAEPLAADMREGGEGRRHAFLQLVAGMLGVGLDELVQRETTQRHRRLGWLAAASLAGMAVTSGLAITAIHARDSARDQRRQAEGLVAFMLGDLKDKLEPIGRLDALDGVGSRVLRYYSGQDASQLSDAGLTQRSRALSLTAQVAFLRGNFDVAARLYGEAKAGTEEAVRRNPEDPQRLFDHAQNVFWTGDLARRRGQIVAAEAAFREYRSLADQMVALQPDNLKWRMEVQYARENLGIVLMSQRRFAEAGRQFANALGPMQSLAAVDPANREYQQEVSNALAWLADARRAEGRLDEAAALREQQIELLQRLVRERPSDVSFQQQSVPARRALGLLLASRGRVDLAVEQYRQAVGNAQRLLAIETGNSQWKEFAAGARLELGQSLLSLNKAGEAAPEIAAGCAIASGLRPGNTITPGWRTLQTICLSARARLALATGARGEAVELARQALGSARLERSGDPIGDRYDVAAAYRLVGDSERALGDPAAARTAWSAGLTQLPRVAAERPSETYERAQLLGRLGRSEEARPLIARLSAVGYQGLF